MNKSLRLYICIWLLFQEFYVEALDRTLEPLDPNASPYEILGLTPEAESKDIRKAFRKLSLKFHPDKNPGDQIADVNFKLVNSAYDSIGDEAAREVFDSYAGKTYRSGDEYEQALKKGEVKGGGDLYKSSLVTSLDPEGYKDMKEMVKNNGTILVVKFFAGWCQHCQMMVPEVKKLASLLEDTAVVAAVNCEKHNPLCEKNNIQSYPTFKLWTRKKNIKGEVYDGESNAIGLQRWVKRRLKTEYTLFRTREEFEEKIRSNRTRPWLINWSSTAIHCPPCIGILGVLRDIAYSLHGLVNVGEVDCKRLGELCAELGIRFYPDLKLYPQNIASPTVNLEHNMMNMFAFPQIGMLRLIDQVSKALLDHILIEQRRNALPTKLENIMKFSGDFDRMAEIPQLMNAWKGAELQLWGNIMEEYELTEDMYENEILPFIEELNKEEICKGTGNEDEETCYNS